MDNDPCQFFVDKQKEALDKWLSLQNSFDAFTNYQQVGEGEDIKPIVLDRDSILKMRDLRKQRDNARLEWVESVNELTNCRKELGFGKKPKD